MKAVKQHQFMRMYAVLTVVTAMVLGLGLRATASNQDYDQQYARQGQNQGFDQYDQGGQQGQAQGRDLQLERQIAAALRQAGYGAQGEIMILATGSQVTLLGTVPSADQKNGVEQITKGVAQGWSVRNRLHVGAQARQMNDTQLRNQITDQLSDTLKRDLQVSVQNGTATLQGHVNNWNEVADAIDAAFSAGASRVNSRFTVGAGAATAQAGAPSSYGYAPGRQGAMAGAGRASTSDLRLAQQVAGQLRQQLPPGQNVQLIPPQSIYVSASQGVVTLHGYVQSNNLKQRAQQIVRSIRGVRNVRNDLTILSTAAAGGQMGGQQGFAGQNQYGQGGQGQYDQDSSWQGFGGRNQYGQGSSYPPQGYIPGQSQYDQSSQMGGRQAGMGTADIALARQVVRDLRQQLTGVQNIQVMRPGTIYVMASSGNIMVYGIITNPSIKERVNQIAWAVPGVLNVTDRLRVVAGAPGTYPSYGYVPGQGGQTTYIAEGGQPTLSQADMALAQQVGLRLRQQLPSFYNVQIATPGTIYVKVDNGTVTLDGFVANDEAKQTAEQIAESVSGVQNVRNSLSIVGIGQTLDYAPLNEDQSVWQNQLYDDQPFEDQSGADQPDNGMN